MRTKTILEVEISSLADDAALAAAEAVARTAADDITHCP